MFILFLVVFFFSILEKEKASEIFGGETELRCDGVVTWKSDSTNKQTFLTIRKGATIRKFRVYPDTEYQFEFDRTGVEFKTKGEKFAERVLKEQDSSIIIRKKNGKIIQVRILPKDPPPDG